MKNIYIYLEEGREKKEKKIKEERKKGRKKG
jgi:hypothetical protein